MKIVAICSHCSHSESDPVIEINFKEGKIYYICQECRRENVINIKAENTPLPRIRRIR